MTVRRAGRWHAPAPAGPRGWPHLVVPQPWSRVLDRCRTEAAEPEIGWRWAGVERLVRSITVSPSRDLLAGALNLSGLIVLRADDLARQNDQPGTVPVLLVRTPWCTDPPPAGRITVEDRSPTGRTDRITRPDEDAVALFWRFAVLKLGIDAARTRA